METNFVNTKYAVNTNTRLSVSTWLDRNGQTWRGAAAIERKAARGWKVDGETAREFSSLSNYGGDSDNIWYTSQMQGITAVERELDNDAALSIGWMSENQIGTGNPIRFADLRILDEHGRRIVTRRA